MNMTYFLILSLSLLIVGILYYLYLYRHPIVLNLSANPAQLLITPLEHLPQTKQLLVKTHRLNIILAHNDIPLSWLDQAIHFINCPNTKRVAILAARLGATPDGNSDANTELFTLHFSDNFPLSLTQCFVYFPAPELSVQEISHRLNQVEVSLFPVMIISMDLNQQRSLRPQGENLTTRWIVLNHRELTVLLLHPQSVKTFISLLAQQLAVVHLSPYVIRAGIDKESAFFGRKKLLAHILNRDPANYLVIGGRQLGKSSLLKRIHRYYQDNPRIGCYYLVLAGDNLHDRLAAALALPVDISLDTLLTELGDVFPKKHRLVLIDEADEFIYQEIQHGYPVLRFFRTLSEQRLCFFIFAGFWDLYETAVLNYQSPLKNFGEPLVIGGLEIAACQKLATEPLALLGIHYTSPKWVERIITETGQRANLIAIVCNDILQHLSDGQREVGETEVMRALEGQAVREALMDWTHLTSDESAARLDRIVVYATVKSESFTLRAIDDLFKKWHLTGTPEQIRQSLTRLELAFIIQRNKGVYSYCVPLFRELLLDQDIEILLEQEVSIYRKSRVNT